MTTQANRTPLQEAMDRADSKSEDTFHDRLRRVDSQGPAPEITKQPIDDTSYTGVRSELTAKRAQVKNVLQRLEQEVENIGIEHRNLRRKLDDTSRKLAVAEGMVAEKRRLIAMLDAALSVQDF